MFWKMNMEMKYKESEDAMKKTVKKAAKKVVKKIAKKMK